MRRAHMPGVGGLLGTAGMLLLWAWICVMVGAAIERGNIAGLVATSPMIVVVGVMVFATLRRAWVR
jgi:flagellar motor component MotA